MKSLIVICLLLIICARAGAAPHVAFQHNGAVYYSETTADKIKSTDGGGTGLTAVSTDEQYPSAKAVHCAIADAVAAKADNSALAPVAFSGDYNDLQNTPQSSHASIYEVRSNSITGAATGVSFQIEMDGFIFKSTKQSTTNYWNVRLVNNTGGAVTIGSSWMQFYGGAQSTNKEVVNMANGAEFNPDSESGDLGYGKEDTAFVHIFDTTNMHLYRWTVTVYVGKAVMVVEKLH
jgi:hypothetical protein